ncbi:MAG: Lipid kinase, YegS/Rv2252/BmrU family [Candidatus Saccharibacteria bacterium]|nr:Lipid kinase, YegS/Rv2252/BmrU family [Candidatus Saccharibacteria bacterium]
MNTNKSERLVVIHNTKSSRAANVERGVFDRLADGGMRPTRFLTPSPHAADNIDAIAHFVQSGDTVLSAAGDGTANAVINGLLESNHEGVTAGFLGYGNFNDVPRTMNHGDARRDPLTLLSSRKTVELNPLSVTKNGEHWRYAALYATLGWTAVAAAEFDSPKVREKLQHGGANIVSSLARLGIRYFQTRHISDLPLFYRDNGELYEGLTDVLAVNGPIMAKIIRSGQDKYKGPDFLLRDLDVSGLFKNSGFLAASAIGRMPGVVTQSDELKFTQPSSVPIQVDGEFSMLNNVSTLRIEKSDEHPTLQIIDGRRDK